MLRFRKQGKCLKVVEKEGNVHIGKAKENILKTRKEDIKENIYVKYSSKTLSLETDRHTRDWKRKRDLKKATKDTVIVAKEKTI